MIRIGSHNSAPGVWESRYEEVDVNSFVTTDPDRTGCFLFHCVEECTTLGLSRTHFLLDPILSTIHCIYGRTKITATLRFWVLYDKLGLFCSFFVFFLFFLSHLLFFRFFRFFFPFFHHGLSPHIGLVPM